MPESVLSEESFFFERSLDLLSVLGFDGYFKRVNPMFTQTLGYAAADFLNRPFLEFVHPEDHAATQAEVQKLNSGLPTLHFENRYRTKEGTYRWLAWTASPQVERGVMYCVARDVTEQKQTQAALRASEERWQLALNGSNDGIWDWNVQTNEVFFSTRWKTMLGYADADIANHLDEWATRVHADDMDQVMRAIQDHFEQKTPFYVFEHRLQCKDGTYKWILDRGKAIRDETGTVLRMVGSHTDITDRRELETALQRANQELEQRVAERTAQLERANAALRESEDRNLLAMAVARMFTFEWEPATDIVKRSPQCGDILGMAATVAEQETGATYFQRVHPADREQFIASIQALTPERSSYKVTYRVMGPAGQTVALEEIGRAIFDSQGQLIRLIGITADVTERQRLAAEVEESRIQLQRQLAEIETIYQSAPIGLNVLDRELRFLRINQRLAEMNGLPVEAHLGRTVREVLPELADAAEALLRPVLETGEPHLNVEIWGVTPAQPGVQRVWMESFLPLKEGDRVIGINTVCEEITERKRAEDTLRQYAARLEFVLDAIQFGIWEVNLQSLPYVADPRSLKHDQIYGYDSLRPEWSYDTFISHVHPDDRPLVEEKFQQTVTTYTDWQVECRILRADGVTRWVWISGSVYRDAAGKPTWLMGLIADTTDRKQAEHDLQESEERLRLGMQVAGFALATVNYANNQVQLSPEAAILYGFSSDRRVVTREQFHATFHPDDRAELAYLIQQVLDPNGPGWFAHDHRIVWPSGEVKWLTVRKQVFFDQFSHPPHPTHAILVALDITQRKQAEEELRRSQERYRLLFETMEDGFCIIQLLLDDRDRPIDYRFLEINPTFEHQTGLQNAVGKTVRELLPNLEAFWFETYGQVALTGESVRFESASAAMNRCYEVYAFRIGEPQERKVAILFKEISDRKAIEAQRERLLQQEQAAREAAERANRMKDEFLAVLSHELRTPLNPILGWAKLLQSPKVTREKLHQGLTTIERNAKQQTQLIDDLLDISRIIQGKITLNFATVCLTEPISAALETVQLAAQAKGIDLRFIIADVEWQTVGQSQSANAYPRVLVRGDAGRLQQVVWNLLSNAIKFTPPGGRVEVRLAEVGSGQGAAAQITVSDTGKGIDPEFLPYVFELFRQQDSSTTRSFGGLGLGLAIARQVVEAHGGTITAASDGEGQGATFTVQLPLLSITNAQVPGQSQFRSVNFANLRVLVVDDEVDSLELIQILLEQEGATVTLVTTAMSALQLLTQEPFDLLISDIGMPEMDGYALIRQVREALPPSKRNIPAIALTAYAGEANRSQILAAGFQTHLAKPIEPRQLLQAIASLVTP